MTEEVKSLLRIWLSRSSISENVNEVETFHNDLTEILQRLSFEELCCEDLLSIINNIEPPIGTQQGDIEKIAKIIYLFLTYHLPVK